MVITSWSKNRTGGLRAGQHFKWWDQHKSHQEGDIWINTWKKKEGKLCRDLEGGRTGRCKGTGAGVFCHVHGKARTQVCLDQSAHEGTKKELILWAIVRELDFTWREKRSPSRFLIWADLYFKNTIQSAVLKIDHRQTRAAAGRPVRSILQ